MQTWQKVIRPAIVLTSLALVGGYIWYNAGYSPSQASRQPDHPEPITESKSELVIMTAPAPGMVIPAPNTTTSTTTIMPGSKFIVLPGSKSGIMIGQPGTAVTPAPQDQQKPAPPTQEGKK